LLGRRRGWLITTQALLIAAIVALASNDPVANTALTAVLALVVAFCSASQDVVIDAFRIESLAQDDQAAGMANYVAGYRIAMLISTFGVFELADWFQRGGAEGVAGWFLAYAIMAMLIGIGVITVLFSRDPGGQVRHATDLAGRFKEAVIDPFLDFMAKPYWLLILVFVLFFKFGDAFAGIMTAPFVLDIGFDKTDYGRVVKVFGFFATLLGGFAGGYIHRLFAANLASLWFAGIVQMLSNLMFVWLAILGANYGALVATIAVENFTGGFGTVIFVAYLSGLCSNKSYTATQYALLSALSAVGRTILSSSSGFFAEAMGWPGFFLLTTVAAVPGLVLLWVLSRRTAVPAPSSG
jgi:PAT family beta-lactamase induction signal transducer AmpG